MSEKGTVYRWLRFRRNEDGSTSLMGSNDEGNVQIWTVIEEQVDVVVQVPKDPIEFAVTHNTIAVLEAELAEKDKRIETLERTIASWQQKAAKIKALKAEREQG